MNKMKLMIVLAASQLLMDKLDQLLKQFNDDEYLDAEDLGQLLELWRQYKSVMEN